jgi:7-cyano-7-deazaguanine tRNA-ribosyltransferase
MHLEIVRHDGPGRLGKLHFKGKVYSTPSLLWNEVAGVALPIYLRIAPVGTKSKEYSLVSYGTISSGERVDKFGILPSHPLGYNVPRKLAEEAVERTLDFAAKHPDFGAVVEGGKYADLRNKCAEGLGNRPILKIADSDRLIKNHRVLVEVVTQTREITSPNTALYMSNIPPHLFSILVYMGVDLFDLTMPVLGSHEDLYFTPRGFLSVRMLKEFPCPCDVCSNSTPHEIIFDELLRHNINVTVASIREVREAMRAGKLRNLVEERAACDINAMGALRILDLEKPEFLEQYTPLYPTDSFEKRQNIFRNILAEK